MFQLQQLVHRVRLSWWAISRTCPSGGRPDRDHGRKRIARVVSAIAALQLRMEDKMRGEGDPDAALHAQIMSEHFRRLGGAQAYRWRGMIRRWVMHLPHTASVVGIDTSNAALLPSIAKTQSKQVGTVPRVRALATFLSQTDRAHCRLRSAVLSEELIGLSSGVRRGYCRCVPPLGGRHSIAHLRADRSVLTPRSRTSLVR